MRRHEAAGTEFFVGRLVFRPLNGVAEPNRRLVAALFAKYIEVPRNPCQNAFRRRKRSMKHEYSVVYQPVEDGWIMARVPELPGAVTQGEDIAEARKMIKEAVELLLQSYRENAVKDAPGTAIWATLSVDVSAA
jgi:predicted RNase H-like HicB family nuclease